MLVHTPGDPGDGFAVAGVAVQHPGGQSAAEGHPGEAVILLQPFDTHADTPSWSSRLAMSSMLSCPGIWPSVRAVVGVANRALYPMR
nr:hypothetical protein [Mycolicibacterium sarraceniae]